MPKAQDTSIDLAGMVARGEVRRLVLAAIGRQVRAAGADPDDVVSAVVLRLVEAQRSARSRYDAARGYSPTTYVTMVARTAGMNALRHPSRHRAREAHLPEHVEVEDLTAGDGTTEEGSLARVLALLDTDEEKEMAALLAAGWNLAEVREHLNLTESEASELRTRVRALLLPLRDV